MAFPQGKVKNKTVSTDEIIRELPLVDLYKGHVLNISQVYLEPRLYYAFEEFITDKRAAQNLHFYKAIIEFRDDCEGKTIDECKEIALTIVDRFLKQGSKDEINISSAMRIYVYNVLGLNIVKQEEEIEDFNGIALFDEDEEDEFFKLMEDDNYSMIDVGEDAPPVGVATTKQQIIEVFDEAWREVQTLIDRNFMRLFDRELVTRNNIKNPRQSYWEFTGYESVRNLMTHYDIGELQNAFYVKYFYAKRLLYSDVANQLGNRFKFIDPAKRIVNNLLVNTRFPAFVAIATTIEASFHGRRDAHKEYFIPNSAGYFEAELRQFNSLKKLYTKQRESHPLLDKATLTKMEKKYQELVKLHNKVNDIKAKVVERDPVYKIANKAQSKDINKHNKKRKKVYFELQKVEDLYRPFMIDAFDARENLELNRIEKLAELMRKFVLVESQFISKLEINAQHVKTRMALSIFKPELEAMYFCKRYIAAAQQEKGKLDKIDPLQGTLDLSEQDFELFYTILDDFLVMVFEYVRSNYNRLEALFEMYLLSAERYLELAEEFMKNVSKISPSGEEYSPFSLFMCAAVTDNNLFLKYKTNEHIVDKLKEDQQKKVEAMTQKLEGLRADKRERMDTSDHLVYSKLYESYLEECNSIEVSAMCVEYRLYQKRLKVVLADLSKMTDSNPRYMKLLKKVGMYEEKIKKLDQRLKPQFVMREKVLEKKHEICAKVMKSVLNTSVTCVKMINNIELSYLGKVKAMWEVESLNKGVDPVKCVKWIGENIIGKDTTKLFDSVKQVI